MEDVMVSITDMPTSDLLTQTDVNNTIVVVNHERAAGATCSTSQSSLRRDAKIRERGRFGIRSAKHSVDMVVDKVQLRKLDSRTADVGNREAISTIYSGPNSTASSTNDDAARILMRSRSGVKPVVSRYSYRVVKRVFDIFASSCAITLLIVPGVILSAVIYFQSPGASPLFSQLRVGRLKKDGSYNLFRMWKFRSMVPNADQMLEELKERNEADGPLFKIKDDPRVISGIGKFIRKHSIDELPQLINVFSGEMSLIGPRPGLPEEVLQYDERAKLRLTVKCGCGGAWQVLERSDSSFASMIDLDLDYIKKRSVSYDLRLILCTIRSMFFVKGAY